MEKKTSLKHEVARLAAELDQQIKLNAILKEQFDIVNHEYQMKIKEQQETQKEMEILLNKLEEVIVEYQEKENQLENEHNLLEKAYRNLEEINEELKVKNQQLAQLDEMKSNFLAMISHELRTPITVMQGNTEILLGHLDMLSAEQAHNLLESMFARIRELIIMVETLLNLASFETDAVVLDMNWFDFESLIAKVEDQIKPLLIRKTIQYELNIEPGIPPVYLDANRVALVLVNLLSNAVKFNRTNGHIEFSSKYIENAKETPVVLFSVRDTGIGIHPSKRKEIFKKFFQIDNSNTRRYGGSGLGLALAYEVVELHKGRIWLESELGQGSTFFMELPQPKDVPVDKIQINLI